MSHTMLAGGLHDSHSTLGNFGAKEDNSDQYWKNLKWYIYLMIWPNKSSYLTTVMS